MSVPLLQRKCNRVDYVYRPSYKLNAGIGVGGLFAETDLDTELKMVELKVEGRCEHG
jgi:hypothetical protein